MTTLWVILGYFLCVFLAWNYLRIDRQEQKEFYERSESEHIQDYRYLDGFRLFTMIFPITAFLAAWVFLLLFTENFLSNLFNRLNWTWNKFWMAK